MRVKDEVFPKKTGRGDGTVQAPLAGPPRRFDDFTTLPPGTRVGRYEIAALLGQGSFGITYRARDTQLSRDVALKEYLPVQVAVRQIDLAVVPRSLRLEADMVWGRDRFLAEATTLARLEHVRGVVPVYDFLEAHGTAYMVMALIRGETLEARLIRDGSLPSDAVERLLPPLLDGLERVHGAGYLHRDIKPANILVDGDGQPVLIDFGAARFSLQDRTQSFTAIHTPGYAPFEQASAMHQGPWTDIYALAATLYHAVTGSAPPNAVDRMLGDTLRPTLAASGGRCAPALAAAVDAGLALRAPDRPQSIAAWRRLLPSQSVAATPPAAEPAGSATRVMPPGAQGVAATPRRRARTAWLAGGVALAAGLAAALYLSWIPGPPSVPGAPPDAAEAQRRADELATRQREKTAQDTALDAARRADEDKARQEKAARDRQTETDMALLRNRCFNARRAYPIAAAIDACTRLIAQPDDSPVNVAMSYNNRGWLLAAQGDLDRAIADFDRAIEIVPIAAGFLTNRAAVYLKKQDVPRAMQDYEAALRLDPQDVDVLILRGEAYVTAGMPDKAEADFDRALLINDRSVDGFVARARLFIRKRDPARALQDYDQALRVAPDNVTALSGRADLQASLGATDRAMADYDRAIALDPVNVAALDGRGALKRKAGDFKGANADVLRARAAERTDTR